MRTGVVAPIASPTANASQAARKIAYVFHLADKARADKARAEERDREAEIAKDTTTP